MRFASALVFLTGLSVQAQIVHGHPRRLLAKQAAEVAPPHRSGADTKAGHTRARNDLRLRAKADENQK